MHEVRAKLKQAILYIERNPKLVRSITCFWLPSQMIDGIINTGGNGWAIWNASADGLLSNLSGSGMHNSLPRASACFWLVPHVLSSRGTQRVFRSTVSTVSHRRLHHPLQFMKRTDATSSSRWQASS
jgi:hypothetical protein